MTEQNHEDAINAMRQLYSESTVRHALNPQNMGPLDDADGMGRITGSCGDTMEIWIKINNGDFSQATFNADGCAATYACGSMAAELALTRNLLDAQLISREDIIAALGGLPEGNHHCAELAANTLMEAIKDCRAMKREPWKKAYRRG